MDNTHSMHMYSFVHSVANYSHMKHIYTHIHTYIHTACMYILPPPQATAGDSYIGR